MKNLALGISDNLSRLQVGFKRELIREVKAFVVDAVEFRADWDANGPAVPGLDPIEAVDRLKKFTQMFEVRARKWRNYCSGEELFGLSVTQYPEMEKTEKEISMLTRLYDLYTDVLTTISGYADILWVDVVANIEGMSEQVSGFQAQCRKLPKALRDWPAYTDCRKKIDDFLEILPLLQALSSPDMRDRHWAELGASPVNSTSRRIPSSCRIFSRRICSKHTKISRICALAPSRRRRWRGSSPSSTRTGPSRCLALRRTKTAAR